MVQKLIPDGLTPAPAFKFSVLQNMFEEIHLMHWTNTCWSLAPKVVDFLPSADAVFITHLCTCLYAVYYTYKDDKRSSFKESSTDVGYGHINLYCWFCKYYEHKGIYAQGVWEKGTTNQI